MSIDIYNQDHDQFSNKWLVLVVSTVRRIDGEYVFKAGSLQIFQFESLRLSDRSQNSDGNYVTLHIQGSRYYSAYHENGLDLETIDINEKYPGKEMINISDDCIFLSDKMITQISSFHRIFHSSHMEGSICNTLEEIPSLLKNRSLRHMGVPRECVEAAHKEVMKKLYS